MTTTAQVQPPWGHWCEVYHQIPAGNTVQQESLSLRTVNGCLAVFMGDRMVAGVREISMYAHADGVVGMRLDVYVGSVNIPDAGGVTVCGKPSLVTLHGPAGVLLGPDFCLGDQNETTAELERLTARWDDAVLFGYR